MLRTIATGLALSVSLICTAASAETISEVLQKFGLAGTWSIDCGRDPQTQPGHRTTYAVPADGPVTFTTFVRNPDGRTYLMRSEVEAVEKLSGQRIRLTTRFIDIKAGDRDVPRQGTYAATLLLIQEKLGSKIRLIESRSADGRYVNVQDGRFKDGTETPPLERCAD